MVDYIDLWDNYSIEFCEKLEYEDKVLKYGEKL